MEATRQKENQRKADEPQEIQKFSIAHKMHNSGNYKTNTCAEICLREISTLKTRVRKTAY